MFNGNVTSLRTKNINKAPELNGISGSGLWYLKNFPSNSSINEKQLIGIVIECLNKSWNQAIVSTRIDFITEIIRQRYNLNIPKSQTVKITLDEIK